MIPQPETTGQKITDIKIVSETGRPYLGMSGIGGKCLRAQWYSFHWVSTKITPLRVQKIFERGDWEEQRIIADLKRVGVECFRRDSSGNKIEITGSIGEEQEELVGFAGHAKGHPDGRLLGIIEAPKTEHLAEFKTANKKNFAKFEKLGVQEAHPVYYSQAQRYMHETKLTRTFFVVTNKDDESRHYERLRYDKEHALELVRKEQSIIMSDAPLAKIGDHTWYECKFCGHYDVCQRGQNPNMNCRTCDHADLMDGGRWVCSIDGTDISEDKQRVGCSMYRIGWGLL